MSEWFVQKTYYRDLVNQDDPGKAALQLGAKLAAAEPHDEEELSTVRYAQGEVYYRLFDLESAMFKWQQVTGELSPWAVKNIGDAYYELESYELAKETYHSVSTDHPDLQVETALQLVAVYAREKARDEVYEWLHKALAVDRSYPDLTELAKSVYEDYQDWQRAVDLAVEEGKRTGDSGWYDDLLDYIKHGRTDHMTPEYFEHPLIHLGSMNHELFKETIGALTSRYRGTGSYLYWVGTMNRVFAEVETSRGPEWETMAALHHDIYLDLTNGDYLEAEIEPVMPDLLRHWELLAASSSTVIAAAAQAAWNEVYPEKETLPAFQGKENGSHASLAVEEMLRLLESILSWSSAEDGDREGTLEQLRRDLRGIPDVDALLQQQKDVTFDRVSWLEDLRQNEEKAAVTAGQLSRAVENLLSRLEEQQVTVQSQLESSISFYEHMLTRFESFAHVLSQEKEARKSSILETYQTMKQMQKEQFESNVPSLIKAADDVLDEEKSVKTLHDDLNAAMNLRLRSFVHEELFPVFRKSVQHWLRTTEKELQEADASMREESTSLNDDIGEEAVRLGLDLQLVNDWKRDLTRMINRTDLPEENIMSRLEPKQILSRTVGKLFGDMQQSRSFVLQQYRRYLEEDDFSDISETLSYKLFFEFDLFERAVEADVESAYTDVQADLDELTETYRTHLEHTKKELAEVQQHPEYFFDPLKIFDMRQKQCSRLIEENAAGR
ncbi:tetratricopeptide repeat protein [Alkalicoccus chagannorensis]|uniref:tetratricopeptide repeat protein n=1 Tax=Alkalicoccus chagannorensis TaxID=427072 RepID=UPI00047B2080|nr:hypothetical protein [Alkalicoccus chagannorensis]